MSLAEILQAYAITFGWAIVGSVSMGIGIVIAVKILDLSTKQLDEWAELKKGNIAVAIVLATFILAVGYVIAAAISG